MGQTQTQGQKGETMAAEYLKKRGFKILERNVRTPFGEIDLICQDQQALVFVEVKLRNSNVFGNPEDSIPGNKLERLKNSINWYLDSHKTIKDYRLDVIAIETDIQPPKISHLENIS
ncbi:MAG: YraN family protein [Patescibacteria group bacterium]